MDSFLAKETWEEKKVEAKSRVESSSEHYIKKRFH